MFKKIIKNFLYVSFVVTTIGNHLPILWAAENTFSVMREEEKTFTYETYYPFFEQRYSPRISFQLLDSKYNLAQYSNPYPEELATFVVAAMNREDYEQWLGFWSSRSQEEVVAQDTSPALIADRKLKWRNIFVPENEIFLSTLVNVGEAQYTYVMAIFEITKKDISGVNVANLYIPMMVGKDGKWYAAFELLKHPVFKRYIESDYVSYEDSNSGVSP